MALPAAVSTPDRALAFSAPIPADVTKATRKRSAVLPGLATIGRPPICHARARQQGYGKRLDGGRLPRTADAKPARPTSNGNADGHRARTVPAQNSTSAQFPHSRTVPHKFFCPLLHRDAK